MLKKIAEFVQSKGLVCEKNLFSGFIDGIEVSGCAPLFAPSTISFAAHVPEENIAPLRTWLEGNRSAFGITRYTLDNTGIYLVFSQYVTVKKYLQCFETMLPVIKQHSIAGRCPFCGEEIGGSSVYVEMNGRRFHSHEKCFDDYVQKVSENEALAATAPSKIPQGIVGAVLGSLLGCVLWGVLYYLGFIAWIAMVLAAFGASFLWDKFGAKNGKAKIATIWITTFVMIAVTMLVTILIVVQIEMSKYDELIGINLMEFFNFMIAESEEFRNALIRDFILSGVFVLICNIFITVQILQTQKYESKGLRKLNYR